MSTITEDLGICIIEVAEERNSFDTSTKNVIKETDEP